jgi:nucleotide-binding universal stress UspA family protein
MPRVRRIVHPTDFSPASGPAFKKAVDMAKADGAALSIVHVLPAIPIVGDAYIAPTAYDEMLRGQRRQAEQDMDRLVKRARTAGVRVTGTVIDSGAVADQVVRAAKRQGADLIVMGTHGYGMLKRAVLGSVAERVINQSSIPVMTVKGK